jgi:RHS repeat-associated protein
LDGSILTAGKSGKVPPGQLNTKTQGGGKTDTETFQYFYHPDHLGSTSYITDASGEVYQHLEYFAFGETFVEEHSNTNKTSFLYNGKELDEETGLYYYGARYYDARTSLWQSVDPLADKYPNFSSYAYVFNNPIRFIDPTGMEGEEPSTHAIKKGETLTSIAKQHGTTVENLQSLNGMTDDKIYAGGSLKVSDYKASNVNNNAQQEPETTAPNNKNNTQENNIDIPKVGLSIFVSGLPLIPKKMIPNHCHPTKIRKEGKSFLL